MEMTSTINCPACGHREHEIMPEDACQYFYKCKGCGVVLKPRKGGLLRVLLVWRCEVSQCTAECGMLRKE